MIAGPYDRSDGVDEPDDAADAVGFPFGWVGRACCSVLARARWTVIDVGPLLLALIE